MMGLPVTAIPEPSHARVAGTGPDGGRPRRASAAPAPGAAARAGAVGVRRDPGAQRLPVGGPRRAVAAGARRLPRAAAALARVALRRGGPGRPLRHGDRDRALLRTAATLGAGLVAGRRTGPGYRRDGARRTGRGAGGKRALPRLCPPGGVGYPARQRARAVAGADPAPAAPLAAGGAGRPDGAGAGRPRPVESTAVEAGARPRLASPVAGPGPRHLHARRRHAMCS